MTGVSIPSSDEDVTVFPVVQAGIWTSMPITFEGTGTRRLYRHWHVFVSIFMNPC